jgi:hypothetical protein
MRIVLLDISLKNNLNIFPFRLLLGILRREKGKDENKKDVNKGLKNYAI